MTTSAITTLDPTAAKPPRSRRWIPFSLKLFLVILVATGVVGVSWTRLHYRRQQLILKKVGNLRGKVMIGGRISHRLPRVLFGAFTPGPLEIFDEVVGVDLNLTAATDDDLAELHALGALSQAGYLGLDGTQVTDKGLKWLHGMDRIRQLQLCGTQITDDGLKHLEGMAGLTVLYLSDTEISDTGLEHLQGLKSLDRLALDRTRVSDAGLEHLQGLTSLGYLVLDRTSVSDAGMTLLMSLKKLALLTVSATKVTDSGVAELRQHLPNVGVLK